MTRIGYKCAETAEWAFFFGLLWELFLFFLSIPDIYAYEV